MDPTIHVDLRVLQDPEYRVRGIGQHLSALLRTRNQNASISKWKTIGLIDSGLPQLPAECAAWVDEVSASWNPCCGTDPSVFLDLTPMSHDERFNYRFRSHPSFFSAAVVYDFIPIEWPGYLPTTASRIYYLGKMARLRNFDLFLPISEYTAWGLTKWLGVPRHQMSITGASVRRSIYELSGRNQAARSIFSKEPPYFVIVIGPDPRKNPEVVVRAVRHLNLLYGARVTLKVAGHYERANKQRILELAGHREGDGFVEFCHSISDEGLVSLYAGAVATIASSHIEGFSLPVVEAAVCGCPVIASTCAAHLELIEQPEALFPSDDSAALLRCLEGVLKNPELRASLVRSQAYLASQFHEVEVGKRFWNAIESGMDKRRSINVIGKAKKPHLAFLSPYPPDQSGVARFTAMTMRASEKLFFADLYSDAPRPLDFEGSFRDAGRVSVAPLVSGRYDAVIPVLGNSLFHQQIFEVFEQYGGPCILHDARLTQFYYYRFGHEKFLEFAKKLLGRSVSAEEVSVWLQDINPPSLLIEPIIERASPLIVHTRTQQAELKRRYGAEAQVTTSCPNNQFNHDELTQTRKQTARERLGIPLTTFLISSFGHVDRVKGSDTIILAIELLRSWNIPAELYFVGGATLQKEDVDGLSAMCGIGAYVHAVPNFVDEATYRDFLIASDAAVQLRLYGFGQFSAALADCVGAGLPGVANSDLAKSCDAPAYMMTVPDRFSPLQVAEQLALIWEARADRAAHEEARADYMGTHNFEYYGKRLIEILGIA
jgi:glycosyltransferase involved in cell wall biosynthesis